MNTVSDTFVSFNTRELTLLDVENPNPIHMSEKPPSRTICP